MIPAHCEHFWHCIVVALTFMLMAIALKIEGQAYKLIDYDEICHQIYHMNKG